MVSATNLITDGSETAGTTFTTASITHASNQLVLASFGWAQTVPGTPSAAGNSLTWVQVGSTVVSGSRAYAMFRAMGSPTTGTLVFTITGGTNTQSRADWSVDEFANVDTSGANGANAVVQSASALSASANSLSVTLAAFANANNATYGSTFEDASNAITKGASFTELGQKNNPNTSFESEWTSGNQTTVNWTYGATTTLLAMAVEISATPGNANPAYAFIL